MRRLPNQQSLRNFPLHFFCSLSCLILSPLRFSIYCFFSFNFLTFIRLLKIPFIYSPHPCSTTKLLLIYIPRHCRAFLVVKGEVGSIPFINSEDGTFLTQGMWSLEFCFVAARPTTELTYVASTHLWATRAFSQCWSLFTPVTAGGSPRERRYFPGHTWVCISFPLEWCQQTIPSVKKTFWIVFTGPLDTLTVLEVWA